MPRYAPLLLAPLTGILFALSLRPWSLEPLGWVSLVPLLYAAACLPRPLWAAGLGLLAAIVAGLFQVGLRGSGASMNYAYAPYLFVALVFMGTAIIASRARQRWPDGGLPWVLAVACGGVLAEFGTLFTPLPVGVALCQHRNVALIQIAALTGIWGISFLLYLFAAALTDAALTRRFPTRSLQIASGLVVLTWIGGWLTLQIPQIRGTKVAAIQDFTGQEAAERDPGAPPYGPEYPDAQALMREAAAKEAQLIVGSENGFGVTYRRDDAEDELNRLARETGRSLVVGHEMNADPKPFNCATLISANGEPVGTHHKMKLFLGERQMMQAGDHASAWKATPGKVGLLICFDNCYTASTRQCVAAGAQVIALPNYDPPTPRAALHNLHAALTPIRAVENQVAYIRADPNGLSQLVDCQGHIVAEAPMYRPVALVGSVSFGPGTGTFYTRFGDWFPIACLLGSAVLWIYPRRSQSPGNAVTNTAATPSTE